MENLFAKPAPTMPVKNKKKYKPIKYASYKCNNCDKKIIKVEVLGLTEMFCAPYTDSAGNIHSLHDYNRGQVKLTCEDNHISTAGYIACCECGWTNKKT
jgi:ribosome biogenesis protein Tsr3